MVHEVVCGQTDRDLTGKGPGFGLVGLTRGMPDDWSRKLAILASRQVAALAAEPVVPGEFAFHLPLQLNEQVVRVLGRGFRQDGRESVQSNYLVHMLALDETELLPAGPAALIADTRLWIDRWEAAPGWLEPRSLPDHGLTPRDGKTWQRMSGDKGWQGALADAWSGRRNAYLIHARETPQDDLTALVVEAQSLLEPDVRWQIPFLLSAPITMSRIARFWISCAAGSQTAIAASRDPKNVIVDLCRPGRAPESAACHLARNGDWIRLDRREKKTSSAEGQPQIENPDDAGLRFKPDEVLDEPITRAGAAEYRPSRTTRAPAATRASFRPVWWLAGTVAILAPLALVGYWWFLRATPQRPPAAGLMDTAVSGPKSGDALPDSASQAHHTDDLPVREERARKTLAAMRELAVPVRLPASDFREPVRLVSVPGGGALLDQFEVSIITPCRVIDCLPEPEGNQFVIGQADNAGSGLPLAVIAIGPTQETGAGDPALSWKWMADPQPAELDEYRSSVVQLRTVGSNAETVQIPLGVPSTSAGSSLLAAIREGVVVSPIGIESCFRDPASHSTQWTAEKLGLVGPDGQDPRWTHDSRAGSRTLSLELLNQARELPKDDGIRPATAGAGFEPLQRFSPVRIRVEAIGVDCDAARGELAIAFQLIVELTAADGLRESLLINNSLARGLELDEKAWLERLDALYLAWASRVFQVDRQTLANALANDTAERPSPESDLDREKIGGIRVLAGLIRELLQQRLTLSVRRGHQLVHNETKYSFDLIAHRVE